ncbi:hypothetical protein FACS189494_06720 [Spirochaetia bacterium]|nr:hypothetical protein FACS189494_06720 [Spirochaetia bacterium]
MLKFSGKAFRNLFEVILCICLIGFVIIGYITGSLLGDYNQRAYGFLGGFLGGIIGFIFVILAGGLVANFLNMVDNVDNIKKNVDNIKKLVNRGEKFNPTHKVRLLTNAEGLGLRERPEPSEDTFAILPNETKVQFIEKGQEVYLNEIKGLWFNIKTQDGIEGWCFSGSLEKI